MRMMRSITGLWAGRPMIIDNPVIYRELITGLRKRGSFVYLFVFVLSGTLAFVLFWSQFKSVGGQYYSTSLGYAGTVRYFAITYIHTLGHLLGLVIVFQPAVSINSEIEQKTWDLLIASPVNLSTIRIGKFLAAFLYATLIFFSLLPTYTTILIMGAVDRGDVLVTILSICETLWIYALVAMYASAKWKRPVQSIFASFGILFLWFYVIPFVSSIIGFRLSYQFSLYLWPSMFYSAFLDWLGVSSFYVSQRFSLAVLPAVLIHGSWMLAITGFCLFGIFRRINRRAKDISRQIRRFKPDEEIRPSVPSEDFASKVQFNDRYNPIYVKDYHELMGYNPSKLRKERTWLLLMGIGMACLFIGMFAGQFESKWIHYGSVMCVMITPFLFLPYAANAFRGEIENNTWDALIASPMSHHIEKISWR